MINFFKNLQNLKIKENDIYLIITFLVYGFYGSGTNLHSEYSFFYFLFPIILIPLIFILAASRILED